MQTCRVPQDLSAAVSRQVLLLQATQTQPFAQLIQEYGASQQQNRELQVRGCRETRIVKSHRSSAAVSSCGACPSDAHLPISFGTLVLSALTSITRRASAG